MSTLRHIISLTVLSLLTAFQLSAGNASIQVYSPRIPVITDREFNIISEFMIKSDGTDVLGHVMLDVDGIEPAAIRKIRLMYSGTMSVIRSRSTSWVISDIGKKTGGGQAIYADRAFVTEASASYSMQDGKVILKSDKHMVKGDNYFYISMELEPAEMEICNPFTVRITEIEMNGRPAEICHEGYEKHFPGTSVRQSGDDGVYAYRIPGLVTTKQGSLIGVYDIRYRSGLDLQNHIDIGVSRSTDKGKTWEKMRVAMDMGEWGGLPQAQNGIGDPAVLVDEKTGEIFIAAVWTHGIGNRKAWTGVGNGMSPEETAQIMISSSKDDGRTWSSPRNITSQVKQPHWYLTLQGPGRGITMQDGTLVFPIQYIDSTRIPCAGIMYSRDHGKTWHTHNCAKTNTTEAQVVETSPGVLMLNMRDNRKTGRAVAVTEDLGRTWKVHPSSGSLIEPVCMASIISVPAEHNILGRDLLLFSNPATQKGRNHMTIKASLDGGYTWLPENSLLIDEEENWGYSCLSMIDNETVGILYESSTVQLAFQAIRLTDIVKTIPETEISPLVGINDDSPFSEGVSAPFCGIIGGNLVMAGGANFPDTPASEGGQKNIYDDIYMKKENGWIHAGKLPVPAAYGAYFHTDKGLFAAGGSNGTESLSDVYILSRTGNKVKARKVGTLPKAVEQCGFTSEEGTMYIAGGLSNGKVSSDVVRYSPTTRQWEIISSLPVPMVQPIAYAHNGKLYVWGGFDPDTGDVHKRGFCLDTNTMQWSESVPCPDGGTMTGATAAKTADGRLMVIGGVDRSIFGDALHKAPDKVYFEREPSHYKFRKDIFIFDPDKKRWETIGHSGKTALAGAGACTDGDDIIIVNGEIKPGVRTPAIWKIKM